MVQNLEQQGSIWGRIGKGFGKSLSEGLSEAIPKEAERYRMSEGLKQLSKESKDLTPFEQLGRLATIPGTTPQLIQSGSELLKQQARGKSLVDEANRQKNELGQKQNAFQNIGKEEKTRQDNLSPSLTTRDPLEATLKPYISKTFPQLQARAGELFNENPTLYNNDPQLALNAAEMEDKQNQVINQQMQGQRTNEQQVQSNIEKSLSTQKDTLNAKLPGNVYSEIEDKAINAVKPKNQGGEGLTEQEAKKKYGKELDEISRDYSALQAVGDWSVLGRSAEENKRSINSIRDKFKKRNDLENFADTLVAENGLSNNKAYYKTYPVSEIKPLNNAIVKLPKLEKKLTYEKGYPHMEVPKEYIQDKTIEAAKELAPLMGKDGSPLSISEELKERGYDPEVWLNYLDKNKKKLDLTARQERELGKPRNFVGTMNDWWLFYFSGLDKLMEND